MKLPRYDDFLLPVLKAIESLGGSANNNEIDDVLIETFKFEQEQLDVSYPKSGVAIIPDRIAWARSYLKYPGLVDNPKRKMWVLTEEGRAAASWTESRVKEVVSAAARADTKSKNEKKLLNKKEAAQEEGSEENADWSILLLDKLQSIDHFAFERLCQRLLRASGFTKVEVTKKTGDGGIDGQGVLRMNLVSFHVLFQCKRYKGSVGSAEIRDFRGAMQGRADKGLVITTGTFTPDARKEATRDGAPAIDLIDGEALCQLLYEQKLGLKVVPITTEIVTLDESFFEDI
jgi:restriction system protein